nr:hypothetical protein [uncultured Allomuricauda sp.]
MRNIFLPLVLSLFLGTSLYGQIKIGENPQNLDASSVLELESSTRVLVITRVTNAQMLGITPLRGAVVYNTDTQCLHFYTGTEWINPCDRPDEQTFTADAIINSNPTIEITEDPTTSNFNFEVGMINGIENIIPSTVNGDLHIQPNSIGSLQLANDSVTLDKLADGVVTGELLQWNGTDWVLIQDSALTITEVDGVVGNEYNIGVTLNNTVLEVEDGGGILSQDLDVTFATDAELANSDLADLDKDDTNEIQDLDFTTGVITLSNDPTPTTIDLSNYDTDVTDDFDGEWASLNNVPAGFADDIDNDSQLTDAQVATAVNNEFPNLDTDVTDDFSGDWNDLANVPAGFADDVDDNTTYTAGAGLTLTGTAFSVNNLAGDVTGPTSATVIANGAVNSAKIADGTITDADISATAAINGTKINPNFGANDVSTTGDFISNGIVLNVPDFVFEKYYDGFSDLNAKYRFRSLKEVEEFVKKHKHLPGIKSASEIKASNEYRLTASSLNHLEKIEELFLHTIEQEKKIDQLKSENQELTEELNSLRAEIRIIQNLLRTKDEK